MAGQRKLYNDHLDLAKRIREYNEAQKNRDDAFPSEPGLLRYLGLLPEEAAYLQSDEHPNCDKNKRLFEEEKMYRQQWLEEHAVDKSFATGCAVLLKQPHNGGFIDKSIPKDSELKITMNMKGIKGGEDAFK